MAEADFSLITYKEMPDLDPDDQLVVAALAERGFKAQGLVWDDPAIDWSKVGNVVLRSTWDYHLKPVEFLKWVDAVAAVTNIWNSPSLVRWNSHKTYLLELEQKGIKIVPTFSFDKGEKLDLGALMKERQLAQVVVKPAIGLSTFGVRRIASDDLTAGQSHLDELLQDSDVLVQPYISSIEDYGERALIFIDGQYSHCVRKTPFQKMAEAGGAGETRADATDAEIEFARRVISLVPEPTLYGRVDVVHDEKGNPFLLELELVEPSLFFSMHPPSVDTFTEALVKRVK